MKRPRILAGTEGIDFVSCQICGERRRVISGRHLSKHAIDRQSYIERYGLSPDELIAKDFRELQSSHSGYRPYSKIEWIAAVNELFRTEGKISTKFMQRKHAEIYHQGLWLFGDWDHALQAAGLNPKTMRIRTSWTREKIITELRQLEKEGFPLNAHYVMRNRAGVFNGAIRHFGSWKTALAAAGVNQGSLSHGSE